MIIQANALHLPPYYSKKNINKEYIGEEVSG